MLAGMVSLKLSILSFLTSHFPSCKSTPLHSEFELPLTSVFCLCWLFPSFFSCITLFMKPHLYSAMQPLPCNILYSFLFIPHCILCCLQHYIWLSTVTHPFAAKLQLIILHYVQSLPFIFSELYISFSICIFARVILNADSVLQHCHPSQLALTSRFTKWVLLCGSWAGSEAVQGTGSRREQREGTKPLRKFSSRASCSVSGEQHVVRPGSACSPTAECISRSLAVCSAEQCLVEPSSCRPGF